MQYSEEAQREIDPTNAECRRWAEMLKQAGYSVNAMWVGETPEDSYGYEWQVWTDDRDWWLGPWATIYNHGTGPEWAGDYGPYYKVILPKMQAEEIAELQG
jgi:hypothetical protein